MKLVFCLLMMTSAVLAADPATKPVEIRRGVEFSRATTNPEERQRAAYDRVVKKIEPSGVGDPARLPIYLDFFKREFVEDPRIFAIDLSADRSADGTIVLQGFVEYAEHKSAVESFFKQLGFNKVNNQIVQLPEESFTQRYARVQSPTFVCDRTTTPHENLTQCLPGDRIYLLRKTNDGWYLAHGPEGYVGYVRVSDVESIDADGFHKSGSTPDTVEQSIATAMELMGTKYVWGGLTKEGVDCSGLVQSSFKKPGINLPRDADQQSYVGRLVATRWDRDGLRRGDLLYFLSRRGTIHHTAIYLGDGTFLEAADPGVKITSFNKADPAYDAKRDASFCFAKRLLE
jgi:cell wall-associated NlpC family hydrolase